MFFAFAINYVSWLFIWYQASFVWQTFIKELYDDDDDVTYRTATLLTD